MRRVVLALAMTVGLAIGTVAPASALDTSVTLNCSDGTSVKLVVDADTLTALTQAVQSMIDYPAGLSCSIIQNPLGVTFGQIVLASPGTNPFIVGGGRWQAEVSCAALFADVPPAVIESGLVAARVANRWSYQPIASSPSQIGPTTLIWVNIAVNLHQEDNDPTSFFGTLNETIPTQQISGCDFTRVSERHFTSKPVAPYALSECLRTFSNSTSRDATTTTHVTQVAGATFPGAALEDNIHFSFTDNGNPGGGRPPDRLLGPPADEDPAICPAAPTRLLLVELANGNISVRNAAP
jgi:hypothetical protein